MWYDWSYHVTMREIGAAEFKAKCLEILDHVDPEGIVITKRGKPVARLMPVSQTNAGLIGKYREDIDVDGDILSTGVRWDAQP